MAYPFFLFFLAPRQGKTWTTHTIRFVSIQTAIENVSIEEPPVPAIENVSIIYLDGRRIRT